MKNLSLLIALVACLAFPTPLWAEQTPVPTAQPKSTPAPFTSIAPAATPAPTPAAAISLPVPVLPLSPAKALAPIASQLGQTIQTLVGVPPSLPPAATAATPTDIGEDSGGQVTDTFATSLFNTLLQTFDALKKNNSALEANAAAAADFTDWLQHQSSDPHRQHLWQAISNDSLIIVGAPLLGAMAVVLFLLPLRLNLRRRVPASAGGKFIVLMSLMGLRLMPALVFLASSLLLLDQNETHSLPRFVILNVIYAISLAYTVRQILRTIFAPTVGHLRAFSFPNPQAIYAYRWCSAFSILIIYGYFFIDVATALHMPLSVIAVFQNILASVLTIMAITVIVQTRLRVAALLRGAADAEQPLFLSSLRLALAQRWHILAIAYLVIGLGVTILGIENGFALMLRGTILTLIVLTLLRLSFVVIHDWTAPSANNPALIHRQILSFLIRPMIWIVAASAIGALWGLHVGAVIASPFGQRATNAFIAIGLTLAILTTLYEGLNTLIERHLNRRDQDNKTPIASARARTLLPMVRNSVFILFAAITTLTFLSAIGINIAPLLAGAGVLGVAIGFGSQTLVKDFLTGLFIVAENTVAVGDIIKIGDFGGVVETLSIRAIRLRDVDGSLHILPFSEVSKITNMSKGFGFAVIDIAVSYESDLDHVMKVMRDVGAKLQEDAVFKRVIMEPIEVFGVETLGDSSITIRARMRTRPGKQWDVRRLLLQRIKERFDQEKIEFPYPTVAHITKVKAD